MARVAVIMQPTYLPWIGYFDLLDQADVFIVFDDAQFSKQSWHQRNRIRTPHGLQWLTVPVRRTGRFPFAIRDAEILRGGAFPGDHLRTIELNYRRAPHFETYFPRLREILEQKMASLCDLNVRLISWLADELGIRARFETSTALQGQGARSALMIDLCRRVEAQICLSPIGSAAYLVEEFTPERTPELELLFQHYEHPTYRQCFEPFLPYASAIDLLFNTGGDALAVMRSGRRVALGAAEAFRAARETSTAGGSAAS
jgi:hypothetical protein